MKSASSDGIMRVWHLVWIASRGVIPYMLYGRQADGEKLQIIVWFVACCSGKFVWRPLLWVEWLMGTRLSSSTGGSCLKLFVELAVQSAKCLEWSAWSTSSSCRNYVIRTDDCCLVHKIASSYNQSLYISEVAADGPRRVCRKCTVLKAWVW